MIMSRKCVLTRSGFSFGLAFCLDLRSFLISPIGLRLRPRLNRRRARACRRSRRDAEDRSRSLHRVISTTSPFVKLREWTHWSRSTPRKENFLNVLFFLSSAASSAFCEEMMLVDVQQTVAVLCSRVCGVLTYVIGVSHDCCTVSKVFSILVLEKG